MSQLLIVSLIMHGIILFFLLVVYSGYHYSTKITIKPGRVSILPAYVVPNGSSKSPETRLCAEKAKQEAEPAKKKTQPQQSSTTLSKGFSKESAIKTKKAPSKSPTKQSAKSRLPKEQNKSQKAVEPKKEPKKQVQKSSAASERRENKGWNKKEQNREQQLKRKSDRAVANSISEGCQNSLESKSGKQQCVQNSPDFCGFDTPQIQQYIQKEVAKKWEPPIGLPEDLWCDIVVFVGNDGLITDSKVERSSGVLVFDLSARSAAASLRLPRWAWGKEFTISFNQ